MSSSSNNLWSQPSHAHCRVLTCATLVNKLFTVWTHHSTVSVINFIPTNDCFHNHSTCSVILRKKTHTESLYQRLPTCAPRSSLGIGGHILLMATLKSTYLLIKLIFFVKNNLGTSLIGDMLISYDQEYLIKELPESTKQATILLGSNHALRCYICYWRVFTIYLKSLLTYKFLIVDTYHPDTTLTWARCEDPWFFRSQKIWEKMV
jgi:hypothetical protein